MIRGMNVCLSRGQAVARVRVGGVRAGVWGGYAVASRAAHRPAPRPVPTLFTLSRRSMALAMDHHDSHNFDSSAHNNIKEFVVKDVNGKDVQLSDLVKKVTLIVNIDCKEGGMNNMECKDLQDMYSRLKEKGLEIVAFPSTQFQIVSSQNAELPASRVKDDLQERYHVSFPVMDKVNVNGDSAHPLFMFLQKRLSGFPTNAIKWDFTSFLCVDGTPMKRYAPMTPIVTIERDVAEALGDHTGSTEPRTIMSDITDSASAAAEKATSYAKSMAQSTFGVSSASEAMNKMSESTSTLTDKAKNVAQGTVNTASDATSKISDSASTIADKAKHMAQSTVNAASETVSKMTDSASNLTDKAKHVAQSTVNSASETASKMSDSASNLTDKAKHMAQSTVNSASETASKMSDSASNLTGKAKHMAQSTVNSASETANKASDSAKNMAQSTYNSASETANKMGDSATNLAGKAKHMAKNTYNSAAESTTKMSDSAKSMAGSAATKMSESAFADNKDSIAHKTLDADIARDAANQIMDDITKETVQSTLGSVGYPADAIDDSTSGVTDKHAKTFSNASYGTSGAASGPGNTTRAVPSYGDQGGQYSSTTHDINKSTKRHTGNGEGPFPGTPSPQDSKSGNKQDY